MSNDLTTRQETSPADMLTAAIEKGIDAAGIKTLAEVFTQMEARRSETLYNAAMAAFQAECPVILKSTKIHFPTKAGGTFSSQYASMDDIVDQTRELRAKHGFSFSFDRQIDANSITIFCEVRHAAGHKTRTPFTIPIPKDAKLSEAHAVAGAVTFAERYAFRGAFGITTGTPDNDGKELIAQPITAEQVLTLAKLIEDTKSDYPKFWQWAGVTKDTLADLPASQFARIQTALLERRSKQSQRPEEP